MHRTIFNTPVVKNILRGISLFFLKILGWKTAGELPKESKYIIVVAPHTSNWDLFYGIILAFAFKLDPCFMAKKELFRPPFGPLVSWLGGVPIDRKKTGNTVDHVIEEFGKKEKFIMAIAPEGTRSKVDAWKTGFYHIAAGAGVPILLAFLDYTYKRGGAGPVIIPGGDMENDMKTIREFYSSITGRYANRSTYRPVPESK